jgi:hypothetical protein
MTSDRPSIVETDTVCPHDPKFVHRFYYGCVPVTFSDRTGNAKGYRQTETEIGLPWKVWLWNGGCDTQGITAAKKLADWQNRKPNHQGVRHDQ